MGIRHNRVSCCFDLVGLAKSLGAQKGECNQRGDSVQSLTLPAIGPSPGKLTGATLSIWRPGGKCPVPKGFIRVFSI